MFSPYAIVVELPTSKSFPGPISYAVQRLPTDAFYYADVDVENVVVGSVWMLGYDNAGTFTPLASGEVTVSNFTIPNVPSFAASFLLELRVRKGVVQPKYVRLNQFAFHNASGILMYVSQTLDTIVA